MRVLESTIRLHWELTALSDYDTDIRFTFHDLALTIRRMHRFFEEKGIKQGDKIAICDKNSSYWGACLLSIITYGAVAVPILVDFNGEQIANVAQHSDAKLLFISDNIWEGIDLDQIPNVKVVVSLNDWHPISQQMNFYSQI